MAGQRLLLRDDRTSFGRSALLALAAIAAATLIVLALRDVAPDVSLGAVYLLAVLVVAAWSGLAAGVFAALLGGAAYNWFLIDPTGHFTVEDARDWYALSIFVLVAVCASLVADGVRRQAQLAELRRQEATLIASAAAELLGEGALSSRLARVGSLIAGAAGSDRARLVPGTAEPSDGETAIEVMDPRAVVATLLVPADLGEPVLQRLRQRIAPGLGPIVASALERDRLAAAAVEAQALRRSDALKTALLRAVSHDLRSPLTAIVAAGTALGSSSLDPSDREDLAHVVVEEADRLDDVISKLLDLSQLEAGSAEPREDWCDVEDALREAADEVSRRESPTPGAFSFAIDRSLPLVRADPAQLERVFVNLLENASRHSAGKPVSVRARVVGGRLVVRVVDQGSGIPAAAQQRVFEPFYRVEEDDRQHAGSGLGLAIAKGFVEANNGRIGVESTPGHGTSFVVSLPVPAEQPASAP